jgi:DNA-binding NarL/FixJ family response regulator
MPIRIALADDHQLVRKGIRLLLESIPDIEVISEATDGKELVEMIESLAVKPDIVLIDVNMPVMNGQQTVIALRETYPEMKLIALSVNNESHIIRELIQLGANAYLFKDSSPETFNKVLHEVFEKGFYYDQKVIESLLEQGSGERFGKARNHYQQLLSYLTARELEFIKHCCSELTYKEIASLMGVSLRTVDGYRESTFDKLEVRSRTGLVLFAFHSGIFQG